MFKKFPHQTKIIYPGKINNNFLRFCMNHEGLSKEIKYLLNDWCLLVSQAENGRASELLEMITRLLYTLKGPKHIAQKIHLHLKTDPTIDGIVKKEIKKGVEERFSRFKQWIEGEIVLDLGAGRGEIGERIYLELNKYVCLVDVVDNSTVSLPIILYNGRNLPFENNRFDTTIVSLVLHHCSDSEQVFNELLRVTKKRIIIQETIYRDSQGPYFGTAQFFDWFVNWAVLGKWNMPLSFQFKAPSSWRNYFKKKKLNIIYEQDLGRDIKIAPEYHWLFVINKTGE